MMASATGGSGEDGDKDYCGFMDVSRISGWRIRFGELDKKGQEDQV